MFLAMKFRHYLYYLFPNDPHIFPAKSIHEAAIEPPPSNLDRAGKHLGARAIGGTSGGTNLGRSSWKPVAAPFADRYSMGGRPTSFQSVLTGALFLSLAFSRRRG
jgi:hypothetical protein